MCRPLIGVIPLIDYERNSYWMLPGYMLAIEQAGGLPVMLPPTADKGELEQLVKKLDGLLFTGGQDIEPTIYGDQRVKECGVSSDVRDKMESILLCFAVVHDIPVLGICRGLQFINVSLGGKLYQDIPTQHPSEVTHSQKPPYDRPVHAVSVVENSPLYALLGKSTLQVNSYHHQAISVAASALRPMAYSEDGLMEAVYMPGKRFLWAFQWHPELNYVTDTDSQKIFSAFVHSCEHRPA